ncbi:multidrug effflux MFS transporter [Mesorhizobium sp. SP-1A]|uniref:multidrug effflux MFS transporter n=1 Tax=Mesorhizobium sp. SP-1A TaxID=3077840 RepID=UPI0028F70A51|nr:multidrug effflux MFS transporter [Mesorhizobium sp. SP-1A]
MTSVPIEAGPASRSAGRKGHAPLWLLAMITLSGTLAMHIFVPALPLAARDLGASAAATQLTLSFYIFGLALGQLVYGPLSDHFGRRPVLIVGMVVYALASIASLLAPTIGTLVAARLLQALGGCSGLVLGRAIVRDRAAGAEAARNLSLMNLMVMAGPGLAPLLGSLLSAAFGWRSIFAALSLLGAANLALIWRLLPETTGCKDHDMRNVLRSYRHLLTSRGFLGFAIGGGCATTSLYAFIGAAPFIFVDELHRPIHEVGLYLAFNMGGVWLGSLTASRLVGRVPTGRLMVTGNLMSCAAALVLFLFVVAGWLNVPSIVIPMVLFCWGAGIASPTALSEALGINPLIAGSASGLYGFLQMVIGAACTALGGMGSNPAFSAATVLLVAGLISQLSFWMAQRAVRPTCRA